MRRDVRRFDPELVVMADLGGTGFGLFVHLMGIGEESPFTKPGRGPRPRDAAPLTLALASVAAIAFVDGTTGRDASMSALYVAVVLVSSWFLRWKAAAAVAVIASASGLAANHPAAFGPPGVAEAALYWNWATRLAAQLGIVYVVGRLRAARGRR